MSCHWSFDISTFNFGNLPYRYLKKNIVNKRCDILGLLTRSNPFLQSRQRCFSTQSQAGQNHTLRIYKVLWAEHGGLIQFCAFWVFCQIWYCCFWLETKNALLFGIWMYLDRCFKPKYLSFLTEKVNHSAQVFADK